MFPAKVSWGRLLISFTPLERGKRGVLKDDEKHAWTSTIISILEKTTGLFILCLKLEFYTPSQIRIYTPSQIRIWDGKNPGNFVSTRYVDKCII
jgi:hypothetical protein